MICINIYGMCTFYICIYVFMYYMYICIHVHIYVNAYIYTCVDVNVCDINTCIHACKCSKE